MREIKFRAWNFKSKKMFSAEEMATDQMVLLPTGQFINIHPIERLSVIYPLSSMLPLLFTGLKDKNGKEIYEGDRIVITDEHGNTDSGVVEYIEERAAFGFRYRKDSNMILDPSPQDIIEVTDNIYENPDLNESIL